MNSKQVSEMFGISIDTLRYYEKASVIPPVTRNENGYRDYRTQDLNWIYLVKTLRTAGMTIEYLQEFLRLSQAHGTDEKDVAAKQKQILIDQLEEVDEKLAEIKSARDLLAYKLETYDDHLAKFKSGKDSDQEIEKLWEILKK